MNKKILHFLVVILYFLLAIIYSNTFFLEDKLEKFFKQRLDFPHRVIIGGLYFFIGLMHLLLLL